jgi:hypothetical protein
MKSFSFSYLGISFSQAMKNSPLFPLSNDYDNTLSSVYGDYYA